MLFTANPDISLHESQHIFLRSCEDMPILPGTVSLTITSPPYWNLKSYGSSTDEIGHENYDRYLERMNAVWDECFKSSKENSVLAININSRRSKGVFYPIAFNIAQNMKNWKLWDTLIWYIPNALPQPNHYMHRLFDNKFEYVLIFVKGDPLKHVFHKPRVAQKYLNADPRAEKKNPMGRCLGNIVRIPAYRPPNIKSMGYHVAAFPEELVALLMETYTDVGDVVLDPFLGSGTTLKVARHLGRTGVGFEVNSEFRGLIEKRINEGWKRPPWTEIDIIHSTTSTTGRSTPRKSQFRDENIQDRLQSNLFPRKE
ncbi:MAG: site-specific DNA-methyltransferase [Alphaproteobacteria bacterium]